MSRVLFTCAVFLSAFLVFQVQPLVGKVVLPWYGGAAAVWTTCLLVFQVLLFAGYAYAHRLAGVRPRTQAVAHVVLLVVAVLVPILPGESWKPAGDEDPLVRIVLMLVATVGLPYLALSASGPLYQAWFHRVAPGRSPYPLYAMSNAGSFLALLTFPFLFEPFLTGSETAVAWRWAFAAFAALSGVAAWSLWRVGGVVEPAPGTAHHGAPPLARRLLWMTWAACGVILFMAVTNQLTLNVASVPFLWILPLAIYLLTFVLAFSGERAVPRRAFGVLLVLAIGAVLALLELEVRSETRGGVGPSVPVELGVFTTALLVLCLVAHGELYRARPEPRHLTSFYLSIALGGALGGIVVGVVAPRVFLLYQELQLGLVLLCLLYVGVRLRDPESFLSLRRGRVAPALALLGVVLMLGLTSRQTAAQLEDAVDTRRSFFGLLRVKEFAPDDPMNHAFRLYDGAIVHGYQFTHPDLRRRPTTYYARDTGVGRALRARQQGGFLNVGVVGLGVGTLAAYGRSGDRFRFYEINPDVLAVARERFWYLSDCEAPSEVVLGDARLQLEREEPQGFDFLVLDAFSSDAVPVHLLTLEAFEVYERHLARDGVLALNVSNRHLELSTVVYRAAEARKLHVLEVRNRQDPDSLSLAADWMILSRDTRFMNELLKTLTPAQKAGELRLHNEAREEYAGVAAWTDDSSSLLRVLK